MATWKEISESLRGLFGVGTKNYEPNTIRRNKSTKLVYVVIPVDSKDDIDEARGILKGQSYQNIQPCFVFDLKNDELYSHMEGDDYVVDGDCFYDATVHFIKEHTDRLDLYYIELAIPSFWYSGHIESLVDASDEGIAISERAQLDPVAGWDNLSILPQEEAVESILWPLRALECWDQDVGWEAVEKLKRKGYKFSKTGKPTLVIPAEKTLE